MGRYLPGFILRHDLHIPVLDADMAGRIISGIPLFEFFAVIGRLKIISRLIKTKKESYGK